MVIFGIEIRRARKEPDPLEALKNACDTMNIAWAKNKTIQPKIRPWILWDEQRIIITEYRGTPQIIHE